MIFPVPGTFLAPALLATQAVALALPSTFEEKCQYPFDYIVAYGDELSDNRNGFYAHSIAGNPKKHL